jgi:hypothetical protein
MNASHVGRTHAEEGEGEGMRKTQHFRKTEELIELRKQLRSVTGVIESVSESIRLWEKSDKLDEYWEYSWCQRNGEIEFCVATVHSDISQIRTIARWLWYEYWCAHEIDHNVLAQDKNRLMNKILMSNKPVKYKMFALRRLAEETALMIQMNIASGWKRWIRRDFGGQASSVHALILALIPLEIELEEHWAFIVGLPSRMETQPLEVAAN